MKIKIFPLAKQVYPMKFPRCEEKKFDLQVQVPRKMSLLALQQQQCLVEERAMLCPGTMKPLPHISLKAKYQKVWSKSQTTRLRIQYLVPKIVTEFL